MTCLSALRLLFLLPLLGGCVMLERAPAALACDSQLEGRWVPLPGEGDAQSPLGRDDYAEVDGQCRVTLVDDKNMSQRPTFPALGFQIGDAHYLALTPSAMRELFNDRNSAKPSQVPETAVLPVNYRIVEDVLELALPDLSTLQPLIKRGELKALETDAAYVLQGDEVTLHALMAEHPELFARRAPQGNWAGPSAGVFRLKRAGAHP